MKKIAIYPGSFDPCTNGHVDIITRASKLFDKLIVSVLINSAKTPTFTVEQRLDFLRRVTADIPNVEVDTFSGLVADYARQKNADALVRGLRAVSDFEYEFQVALTNKKLNPAAETIFLTTSSNNMYLSSSIVKEIGSHGGDLSDMVPPAIKADIERKLQSK